MGLFIGDGHKVRTAKSLVISSIYYPPDVGGISRFMSSLVAALGPGRVCCLTGVRSSDAERRRGHEERVYRRPLAFAKSKYLQAVGWGAAVAEIVLRERPRAVQLATLYDGYLGMWLKRWLGIPFVIYAHGNEVLDAMQGSWDGHRRAVKSADRVLANSRFTVELLKQAGVSSERIELVHPGCDVERFRVVPVSADVRRSFLGSHASGQVILTVGRLVSRKGHDLMIRALPMVLSQHPDTVYLIVGSGPAKPMLEQLADEMGVRDRVLIFEKVEDADLPIIYNLCDVFVMPSRADLDSCDVEGFGIVFLEANACGKPVIAGRSGGIADAVVDGETGLLVPPDSSESLAEAICRILTDRELASQLGRQGRERTLKEFSWNAVAGRVDRIITEIATRGSRVGRQDDSLKGA